MGLLNKGLKAHCKILFFYWDVKDILEQAVGGWRLLVLVALPVQRFQVVGRVMFHVSRFNQHPGWMSRAIGD